MLWCLSRGAKTSPCSNVSSVPANPGAGLYHSVLYCIVPFRLTCTKGENRSRGGEERGMGRQFTGRGERVACKPICCFRSAHDEAGLVIQQKKTQKPHIITFNISFLSSPPSRPPNLFSRVRHLQCEGEPSPRRAFSAREIR